LLLFGVDDYTDDP